MEALQHQQSKIGKVLSLTRPDFSIFYLITKGLSISKPTYQVMAAAEISHTNEGPSTMWRIIRNILQVIFQSMQVLGPTHPTNATHAFFCLSNSLVVSRRCSIFRRSDVQSRCCRCYTVLRRERYKRDH